MSVCMRALVCMAFGKKQSSGLLGLPISDTVLEAVGLSPKANLDIMSRLGGQPERSRLSFLPWSVISTQGLRGFFCAYAHGCGVRVGACVHPCTR